MKIVYTHDCLKCEYQGSVYFPEADKRMDVYIHPTSPLGSVVLRYGSEANEYISLPSSVVRKDSPQPMPLSDRFGGGQAYSAVQIIAKFFLDKYLGENNANLT